MIPNGMNKKKIERIIIVKNALKKVNNTMSSTYRKRIFISVGKCYVD